MSHLSLLNTVRINGKFYKHYIHTGNDSTFLVAANDPDKKLWVVTNDARVLDEHHQEIGRWLLNDKNLYCYESHDGTFTFESGNRSLIKAEVKLFKKFMNDDTPDWRYEDGPSD